ncbi:TetR/AcrR family transcriptional regulator [Mycolicibacterium sp.]|uniref:TetR/AcrR family transcriptional regulator n=1 Tax=Mycolicibacterium sp. TaxID=2320850 RepID=UPI001A279001|nr:TetR/AcrR family transcriptional regulator [Mycolicibacterium sp.]MBJ7341500.1 TetR/AcrR family transcriptional regulator [Mycolicibacterium sp.]
MTHDADAGTANEVQAILAAAEEELTLLGLRRSSVDEMARKAGVSRSTLYRRFKDKEHLVVAVINKVGNDAVTELETAVSGCGPEEVVVAAFCTYVHILNTRKILRRLLIGGESALPHELVRILERTLTELLVSHLATLLKEAGSPKPDEELLVISELLFKISFAYLGRQPSRFVSFDDPAAVRAFATKHLAMLIREN